MMRSSNRRKLPLMVVGALLALGAAPGRADTVASLLGNFTINQYCGLRVGSKSVDVHYVVVFGQLPALRELHLADADGDGVTSQTERNMYVGKLAPSFAEGLELKVDGATVPVHATHWTSSLPAEQGGFSLRVDVDFSAELPASAAGGDRGVQFTNNNYAGRLGWHEIVVTSAPDLAVFDTNAYNTSLTEALTQALQALPASGPLDERTVHFTVGRTAPSSAVLLAGRSAADGSSSEATSLRNKVAEAPRSTWIERRTRGLVEAISVPLLTPGIAVLALLGALLLGAVHALSPGHGKTVVGAYLIGSRGTPRHALFLGLTVTMTHTMGVFALGFATLYASRFIVPERLIPILSLLSAVLVLGMGLALLVQRGRAAREALSRAGPARGFQRVEPTAPSAPRGLIFAPAIQYADPTLHSHGGGPLHSHLPPGAAGDKITWRSLLALGISGGLLPCPSAMVLLLAAVALNKTAYGMFLVLAFSIGLAITLTLVGLAFLCARHRFAKPSSGTRWLHLLPALSALTITVLGIALCFGALKSFGS
jgi:ABC-type nickel/cobalt efflux system permease component RcnA